MSTAQTSAAALELEIAAFKRRGIVLTSVILLPFACIYSYVACALLGTQGAATLVTWATGLGLYVGFLLLQRTMREKPAQVRRTALSKAVIRLWLQSSPPSNRALRERIASKVSADKMLVQIPAAFLAAVLKAEHATRVRRAKAATAAAPAPVEEPDMWNHAMPADGPFKGFVSGNGLFVDENTGLDAYGDGIGQKQHDGYHDQR